MLRKWLLLCCVLLLGACSSDIELFGYTIWGVGDYSRPSSVRVEKGDTLYSISRAHDVPMREVIEINGLRPPYTLRVGQTIRLPAAKYHIVAQGDTLYNISRRYNVDMPTLSRVNNLTAPWTLHIGQKLLLPGSIVTRSTRTTATTTTAGASGKKYATKKTATKKTSAAKSYTYVQPSTKRKTKIAWPVKGTVISKFGPVAKGRNNDGINIKAARGTVVKAADAGTVAYAGNELRGFGNLILIKHNDGWVTAYAHNDTLKVRKGQKVAKGTPIATVGTTGGMTTPQLHFETRSGKKAVNPLAYLP